MYCTTTVTPTSRNVSVRPVKILDCKLMGNSIRQRSCQETELRPRLTQTRSRSTICKTWADSLIWTQQCFCWCFSAYVKQTSFFRLFICTLQYRRRKFCNRIQWCPFLLLPFFIFFLPFVSLLFLAAFSPSFLFLNYSLSQMNGSTFSVHTVQTWRKLRNCW